ncbi:signal recognition particle-docking protein FtsY [Roseomonas soli]|uniref:Signal recognition particle receptor FtsY n=1 Tax=Neoroseomonas soli TaxID=1081025 RepID=A0A9X9WRT2_9PROT|nr:signal recognition particle-docking protein FtsY [Neoroseomonas soli]
MPVEIPPPSGGAPVVEAWAPASIATPPAPVADAGRPSDATRQPATARAAPPVPAAEAAWSAPLVETLPRPEVAPAAEAASGTAFYAPLAEAPPRPPLAPSAPAPAALPAASPSEPAAVATTAPLPAGHTATSADTTAAAPAPQPGTEPRQGWFSRLKAGLARSTAKLTDSVTTLFRKRRLDEEALEELEETLIAADLGVAASRRIVEGFRKTRFGKEVTDEEVKATLAEEIAAILAPVAQPLVIEPARAPHVVLVVGVNGTGKTTTIAKLGRQYREAGLKTGFVAGDTFRAAAVEQLQVWADRTGARFFPPAKPGADAAGLAFDALGTARAEGLDVLLVDTAGRLHNKSALMEELRKVIRVIRRVDETAPHSVLLVLDATTGQNAVQQVKVFKEMVDVSGLAVTKLDGSAKGGVVVALAQEFGLPVHVVGVGEKAEDLRPFEARDYARGLLGLE